VGSGDLDLIAIFVEEDQHVARAEALAKKLKLRLFRERPSTPLCLVVGEQLGLTFSDERPFRPFTVDFLSAEWQYRHRQGLQHQQDFLRAFAFQKEMRILDVTAGFGQDAFVLAWAGAQVTALEKNPIVFELLADGLRRAGEAGSIWTHRAPEIRNVDSLDCLNQKVPFDAIYIDTMFDKPKKSAKSPKPMQLLQTLLQDETANSELLLQKAQAAAAKRVVVKLPLKAQPFGAPAAQMKGQSIRYDIYLI
jgi:16S rRNA (guanine1516-N2)-methyltransferase